MGQHSSRPERAAEAGRENRRSMIMQSIRHSMTVEEDGLLRDERDRDGRRQQRLGSAGTRRLSHFLRPPARVENEPAADVAGTSRRSGLQRTATRVRNMLGRSDSTRGIASEARPVLGLSQHRASYVRAGMNRDGADYYPPRLPSIDVSSTFDHDTFAAADELDLLTRSSSSRRSNVVSTLNALRAHRPSLRQFASSLRRPRSPQPSTRRTGNEDQAAMLSRLLSVAAAATAATLIGDDHQALSEARSLTSTAGMGDLGSGEEDGSFDGFLRALQNGRIASALRQGGGADSDNAPRENPLNFFRMFRFGASGSNGAPPLSTGLGDPSEASDSNGTDGRMVPIIIVGIRSINPNSGSGPGSAVDELPPFIDALGNFPSPLPANALGAHGHDSIDSILRPPQNGTSFRHRRRASMGGFGMGRNRISDRLDDQRDHRSPDRRRDRPWSVASSSSTYEPRPPPATPASPSPELSRISSRTSTPSHSRPASFVANSVRDFSSDSRRNSTLHRASAASPLSAHTEETSSLHSGHSATNLLGDDGESYRFNAHRRSDTAPNVHYPRFSSGHPRRNGVVEPDHLPSLSRSSTSAATDASTSNNTGSEGRSSNNDSRSWIIYVLGGSYPENHPILTTPSLFTENPTYEDMMLLSALLGPAKAPVASEEDVQSAGGIYDVEIVPVTEAGTSNPAKVVELVAVATEGEERVEIEADQRCLVCLCDFEEKDTCRKLVKCSHLFHKECIDQWLTQGRNSCPLCRGQGVDEQEKPETPTPDGTPARPAELSAA
ncbi:hypothetical protein LTR91_012126 [Friedmanniomyces endolithicus]|uniref:RING-type domain-containing protein n=1 Tax=Friedmanniomyces endolithicus TaxID=329885 RepID=A0AAN6KGR0_9PEZI|nr:hypothetical protein LTR01_004866 [Friedmanniomyces endolithicus]KAK0829998.1 hypothetical protein LTR73_004136 [Friedmanniomyces endolithicus]KAK0916195.1 hypothetical protein LTR57_013087 [Friedmanniomyces endolithicus]KAK0943635.1 hypothetical protein LTR29_004807 [Friedmanniomyces endolithicus]KAK0980735.1 hypothetical protein LTR91_012126 [Friedmanniomyces endolithicus]